MTDKLASSTDKMLPNKAAITMPELTLRLVSLLRAFVCLPFCQPAVCLGEVASAFCIIYLSVGL